MTLAELAATYEARASIAHARGLAGAAAAVTDGIETALAPHRRTGESASELRVTPTASGLDVDDVRYLPFIKDVPRGEALEAIAAQGYAAGVRAVLEGGS